MYKGKLLLMLALVCLARAEDKTALDRYVAEPDPHYSWRVLSSREGEGFRETVLELISQKWLTTNEVNQPIWKHHLTVIQPGNTRGDTGLLFIGGGSNERPAPERADRNLARVAMGTRSVVAELRHVPNQPLTFKGEERGRYEDSLIAYTWDKYLRTGDERWPARLPMTKSAVRAMDAITEFCASPAGGETKIERFVVAGASKRGWTTWSTAAVDDRVVAIVPIVIDLLNIVPSFQHHYKAYGFWAPAVKDYEEMGIMNWMDAPEFEALMKIEEPFEYRERFTMPKFVINSAGDQFFLPDSAQFYFEELPGVKYLRYVPNSDHSLRDTDAVESLAAFHDAIIREKPLPQFKWSMPDSRTFRVESKTPPARVRLWSATNPENRDFRLDVLGPKYESTDLRASEPGVYIATVPEPPRGWTAFFVELTFENDPVPYKFTTDLRVIPDNLPHPLPSPERPRGFLSAGGR